MVQKPTYIAQAYDVITANNKSMFAIVNTLDNLAIKIREIWIVSSRLSAVTGVLHDFRLKRITGVSAGTAITPLPYDTRDTLPSGVTVVTGGTVSGEVATDLDRFIFQGDEIKVTTADAPSLETVWAKLFPAWRVFAAETKPLTLRLNEGLTAKEVTNNATGSFDIAILFTTQNSEDVD